MGLSVLLKVLENIKFNKVDKTSKKDIYLLRDDILTTAGYGVPRGKGVKAEPNKKKPPSAKKAALKKPAASEA
eukprot:6038263-Alexandrium_andersonii.AAC.1